jgi:uncharacterized protein (TIGR00297 family)
VNQTKLAWQSKLVLLLVVPYLAVDVMLRARWWSTQQDSVALWAIGLSLLLALVVLKLRAATPTGALTGAVITASLMFSTASFPYQPWNTALPAVLAVSALAWAATKVGRTKKERLGTGDDRRGRSASQIAANLGVAALACSEVFQSWLTDAGKLAPASPAHLPIFAIGVAALAEAAADTVSSEIGQVLGGRPRLITTLRVTEPGTDGAVSMAGTLAGVTAAVIVAATATLSLRGGLAFFAISLAGAVFGLLFDSLLGATLERRGWLNNDMVNFLSTAAAAAFSLGILALIRHLGGA